ncbi:copper-binding protein [Burkholderia pseudomallei]|uniref:copper-binding protein n=1 Tax=Burkholderia pseudomallei TaxID=28450 RepID=UPI00018A56C8|nr:copper-binding protein [Burkholderia pseudomallei]AIP00094.1 copper binding periplasmic CusF family protein [Burkholderia pseudomallei 576]EEC32387.1 efflux transporter, RND family, MFP subunit [Burkholderia pseudomallei 576]KAA8767410.1 copper-binding protein [Burkholderia pseudomallei]KGD28485.1 copper binding periplasmic CusF family protein [Burkholderia pseudomallei]KGS57873.1 copper binding periplasmic CusF family protein [Burkholderia pseudomallei MSHR5609]
MKNVLATIAIGCALAVSNAAHAAGEMSEMSEMSGMSGMSGMDMQGSAPQAGAAHVGMSHGEVKKVDTAAGKLTIKHGPLENLGMGAMTMVFKVKDPAMLSQVKAGDTIDFVADEVDGALTVVKLQKP